MSGYHPQTDGLVETFNATMINMIARNVSDGTDWDTYLPYVLFAYCSSLQETTFFLLCGGVSSIELRVLKHPTARPP